MTDSQVVQIQRKDFTHITGIAATCQKECVPHTPWCCQCRYVTLPAASTSLHSEINPSKLFSYFHIVWKTNLSNAFNILHDHILQKWWRLWIFIANRSLGFEVNALILISNHSQGSFAGSVTRPSRFSAAFLILKMLFVPAFCIEQKFRPCCYWEERKKTPMIW